MPFVGGGHIWLLLILLAIVLIIWGPGKLPDIGSGMGRAIREFRKAATDVREHSGLDGTHEAHAPTDATDTESASRA